MAVSSDNTTEPQFILEVSEGQHRGAEIPLRQGDLVVGRGTHCGIRLPDDSVAPTHCGLRVRADQVIVAPGGTVSETLINGEPLRKAQLLRVGDTIGVGCYRLLLRVRVEGPERRYYPGDQVGPWRLIAELGAGAVGRVFEAQDASGRTVALKTLRLRSDWSSREEEHRRALFRREGAALALIDHPHVVRSFGSSESDGIPWLAMELIQGMTLRELLIGGRPDVALIERIMFQLCGAVAACHDAGVIHRDLKPANVMLVGAERRVCLADFGLAQPKGAPKLDEVDPPHFSTAIRVGRQVGTPAYMPPEQTQGREADLRSDVWSLGVVLYELVSGRRPFPSYDLRTILNEVCHACPEPLPGDLQPYLSGIVYKCLQKKPDWRFATAREMVDALHEKRVVQVLPAGSDGPPQTPLTGCPHCGAPIEHPNQCGQCAKPIYRYTDGQVLTVGKGRDLLLACGNCGSSVETDTARCPTCGMVFADLPPAGLAHSAKDLGGGGPLVVDVYDQAMDLLEHCPYCNSSRGKGKIRCGKCGLPFRAYVTSRVLLSLSTGGWSLSCGHCGAGIDGPDEPYCPDCGLNLTNGQFPNGTRCDDRLPPALARRLQERD
ncbi:MAG: protein kinase [Armatimonadetes bacterium]|nr:protein kinase [Armatimonadota bacterium]